MASNPVSPLDIAWANILRTWRQALLASLMQCEPYGIAVNTCRRQFPSVSARWRQFLGWNSKKWPQFAATPRRARFANLPISILPSRLLFLVTLRQSNAPPNWPTIVAPSAQESYQLVHRFIVR